METRNGMQEDNRAPLHMGAAHDPGAIRRLGLAQDNVSVVHSGETDPMPNQEAQEAYRDTDSQSDPVRDDENDYDAQQSLAEDAGPGAPEETAVEIDAEEEGGEGSKLAS